MVLSTDAGRPARSRKLFKDSRISANLVIGGAIVLLLLLTGLLGPLFVNPRLARVGAVKPNQQPTAENVFGTDAQGRDVFTTLILAVPSTLQVGLVAGFVSLAIGLTLGLIAGFFGGWADWLIRTFSDVLLAIPVVSFLILIVARMDAPNLNIVAIAVAALTWGGTARGIRAQVLTIRERSYTAIARANGEGELELLFREIVPNLLPLMMASFIGAVTAGIYSTMALEVLGLGSKTTPSLGMMIFWTQRLSAVLRGQWWWWGPPIGTIALLFIGLFLLSRGLDWFVNPRLTTMGLRPHAPRIPVTTAATAPGNAQQGVLDVRNLQVVYETADGTVRAVDDVSFTIQRGERMGLIGESGSGKTTMATAVMRLTKPPAYIVGGQILLDGEDLLRLSDEELRKRRLKEIALMPQAAMNSLNPVVRVGPQITDAILAHENNVSQSELNDRVSTVLKKVGLNPNVAGRFPHQLSGGMKQRVAMAIAIVLRPKVIIADEPTSALDVVVQQQVMDTLGNLQRELNAAVLLIGHDMGLVAQFSDTIGVLYAGKLVERGAVQDVIDNPLHPYTRMLIDSLPDLEQRKDLVGIPGLTPSLLKLPTGCAFHPRCPFAFDRCRVETPVLQSPQGSRQVACHLYPEHTQLPALEKVIESDGSVREVAAAEVMPAA